MWFFYVKLKYFILGSVVYDGNKKDFIVYLLGYIIILLF